MGNRNNNCKIAQARKTYKCDCCKCTINIGDIYLRINIKNRGIFHFCNNCKDDEEFIDVKINNPEVDYEEFEEWMTEAICWNGCSDPSGY